MQKLWTWLLIAICGCGFSGAAQAAEPYPAKPIRMVVPYSPGGNTDVFARLIAQRLTLAWGQPVVVDNRAGGNTLIGTELVARSIPDGYTIMLTTLTFTVSPSLYKKLPYDTLKDFTPITLAVMLPNVLVVHPSVPAKSLKELIQLAKANPGKLNYASTGNGSSPHLSMELLKAMAGINLVNIPYKGGGPAMADLMGGQISAQFIGLSVAIPHIKSGKLRALAVTSAKPSSVAPDIPAVAETIPGYELDTWFGVLGPGGMPAPLVQRLQEEIAKILRSPDFKEHLVSLGAEPVGSTPAKFAAHIKSEIAKYAQIVKSTGILVE